MKFKGLRTFGVAVAVVAALTLLSLTSRVWEQFDKFMAVQKDRFVTQFEKSVGLNFSYSSLSPNILEAFEFLGVKISTPQGHTIVQAASVRLRWNFVSLLSGKFDDLFQRVQVINGSVDLDPQIDQELLDRIRKFLATPSSQGLLPPVEGFNVSLSWKSSSETVNLERGFFQFFREGGDYRITFRSALQAQFPSKGAVLKALAGQLDGDLRANPSFTVISVQARTSQLTSNLLNLAPLHLQLRVNPATVELVKVQDSLPLDFRIEYNLKTERIYITARADRFKPSTLVGWKGSELIAKLLDANLTGQFSLDLSNDTTAWTLVADGEAGLPPGLTETGVLQDASVLRGRIEAIPGEIRFHEAYFDSSVLSGSFDGSVSTDTWLPEGQLVLDHWQDATFGKVSGVVDLLRVDNTVTFTGRDLVWKNLNFSTFQGWVEHDGDLIAGSVDATHSGAGVATQLIVGGRGSLGTRVFPLTFQVTNLTLPLVQQEIAELGVALELPEPVQGLLFQAKGALTVGPEEWSLIGLDASFADPAVPGRNGQFKADYQNNLFRLKNVTFEWAGQSGTADFQADLSSSELVSWQVQAGFRGDRYDVTGLYSYAENRISFSGSHGLAGNLTLPVSEEARAAGDWSGNLKLEELPLATGLQAAFDLTAEKNAGVLKLVVKKADLQGTYPWNDEPFTLQTKGIITDEKATFSSVSLKDSHNKLQGSLTGNWNFNFEKPWIGNLALKGVDGVESLELEWNMTSLDKADLALTTSRLDLGRWVGTPFRGRVGLRGTAQWKGSATTWSVGAIISEAHWGDSELAFRFAADGNLSRASFQQLQGTLDPVMITDGHVDVDLNSRTWSAEIGAGVKFGSNRWSASFVNSGNWKAGDSLDLVTSVSAKKVLLGKQAQPDFGLNARFANNLWKATLSDNSVAVEFTTDGQIKVQTKAPFPVHGSAVGQISSGKIEMQVKDEFTDISLVREFADKRLLDLKAGVLSGSFTVSGVLTDPEIRGYARLDGLIFDTPYIRTSIGPVSIPLEFKGRSVSISATNIGPSGQIWNLSGIAALDHLIPQEYRLALETDPLSSIPYSYLGLGIKAEGSATGTLLITGNPFSLVVGGKMTALDSTVMMASGSYIPTSKDYFGINSDLTIVSGRKVEFLFPNQQFPLLKAYTGVNQTLKIRWNEAINDFALVGKIDLKSGELSYLNQTFVLKEGSVTFNEDENGIDPLLSVRAELKTRSASGAVTITMRVDGSLSQFTPKFSAQPYRSAEELQQLIGTTLAVPTEYSQASGVKTAISLASDVGTGFLLRPFEESVKKNFSLDLFSVKTELLKKSLLDRNTALGASDYLDNTHVYFGKYVGDDLFLQGSLAFQQGSSADSAKSSSFLIEPEISVDFQTPFFLLNWTLQPQHPETLFVSDNTVTFRWDWSY